MWKATAEIQTQGENPLTFRQATSVLYHMDSFSDFLLLLRDFTKPYQTAWLAHLGLQESKRGLEVLQWILHAFHVLTDTLKNFWKCSEAHRRLWASYEEAPCTHHHPAPSTVENSLMSVHESVQGISRTLLMANLSQSLGSLNEVIRIGHLEKCDNGWEDAYLSQRNAIAGENAGPGDGKCCHRLYVRKHIYLCLPCLYI